MPRKVDPRPTARDRHIGGTGHVQMPKWVWQYIAQGLMSHVDYCVFSDAKAACFDKDWCEVSKATVAANLCISEDTVKRSWQNLQALRLISIDRRNGGTNIIRVHLDKAPSNAPECMCRGCKDAPPSKVAPRGKDASEAAGTRGNDAPRREAKTHPKEERKKENSSNEEQPAAARAPAAPAPVAAIADGAAAGPSLYRSLIDEKRTETGRHLTARDISLLEAKMKEAAAGHVAAGLSVETSKAIVNAALYDALDPDTKNVRYPAVIFERRIAEYGLTVPTGPLQDYHQKDKAPNVVAGRSLPEREDHGYDSDEEFEAILRENLRRKEARAAAESAAKKSA